MKITNTNHVLSVTVSGTPHGVLTYTWKQDSTAFTGTVAANGTITVTENATYVVIVADTINGCSVSDTIIINDFIGLNINEISKFTVYPNPNNGQFSIDFGNITNATRYEIIDAKGAVVTESVIENHNATTVNINVLPGSYYVKVYTTDKIYVEPVVIR